ncbi:MAG: metal-dependent hydrolase [Minwuia sp.]|uniref:metal-dependent hydrolase n=1 Tax=Minwuia sp. TaxID=2493630 RepID=UPI003A83A383
MISKLLKFAAVMSTTALLATAAAAEGAMVHWYGQAAFKITTPGGKVILIDPFISKNPKTPDDQKDLAKIGNVDLILVTHGHGDHVGDTFEIAKMTGAKVAMNADMGSTYELLGVMDNKNLIRFNKSGPIRPIGNDITITMVRAEHSSSVKAKDPISGKDVILPGGEPAGYIIRLENGYKIYHAGDTGVFRDMLFINNYYKPKLALLPIGGHFTMGPAHAAYAIRNFLKDVETVMPMHYGTFPPLKGTPEALITQLKDHKVDVVVMQPGETREF